jgi:aldehyde:ferredoxin oxidoreductase
MGFGWTGRCLNIDLDKKKIYVQEQEQEILNRFLGGRGLNVYTLMKRQAPGLEYHDPGNNLCFGTGPLTGTSVPANGRHNVSSKSPLTGLLGDSNSGGFFAVELKYAGYDQLIISGRSEHPVYITINNEQVAIADARHLWGKNVWETEEIIRQELKDDDIQIASIGQAGENRVRFAAVMNNMARAAGRTGMGAVMGSKNLKAVVVRGTKGVKIAHPDRLAQLNKQLLEAIYNAPSYGVRSTYGTSMLVDIYNTIGVLPTRNALDSVFEDANSINGQTFLDKYKVKSKACFACPVHCGHFYSIKDGAYSGTMGEGVEFETMCSLGSKLGNRDLAAILKANNLCNQYGIDTISTGGVIAFIAECYENGLLSGKELDGLDLEWGNADAILKIIEKIALREGVGDLLAEGVERISKSIPGSEGFVQTIKGMEVPTQDVRGLKAWALGWAVSSRGADHCRAFPLAETTWLPEEAEKIFGSKEAADRLSSTGKAAMVKWYEEMNAVGDSLELCRIAQLGCNMPFGLISEILQAVTGVDFDEKELFTIGERIINLERIFNLREGLKPSDDRLPGRFTKEPVKKGSSAGQVVNLEPMLTEYYKLRQWDRETGWPDSSLIGDLGLQSCE